MEQEWTSIIRSKNSLLDLRLKEVWEYKDLIFLFTKRNLTTTYKQTILGPIWLLIAPLISTFISSFVFGTVAKIPSEGVPYFIFYMCGNMAWSYFSKCFNNTSTIFIDNAGLFGKVYFPRLTSPFSIIITALLSFGIQLILFIGFLIYFIARGADCHPNLYIFLIPFMIMQMALLGMGCGIIVSSLTTKYRDLVVLVGFGVTLWMYITPIIYSVSSVPKSLRFWVMLNPLTPIIETFRLAFLGVGQIRPSYMILSVLETAIIVFIGIVLFNKVEKTFMDTV